MDTTGDKNIYTIKIIDGSEDATQIFTRWKKYCLNGTTYKNIRLTLSNDADFFVVNDAPRWDAEFDLKKTIILQMEPSEIVKVPWGADKTNAFYFFNHTDNFNASEWHLSKTLPWLLKNSGAIEKTKTLSAITSSHTALWGHRNRLEMVAYLDETVDRYGVDFDFYGRQSPHDCDYILADFAHYRGELPNLHKELGLFDYKYHFAGENSAEPNYFTEKILDPILSECLTFYWGCPNLPQYIDDRAYIYIDIADKRAALMTILNAIAGDEWENRREYILAEKQKVMENYSPLAIVSNIIAEKMGLSGN